jgi:hypothetical protein
VIQPGDDEVDIERACKPDDLDERGSEADVVKSSQGTGTPSRQPVEGGTMAMGRVEYRAT